MSIANAANYDFTNQLPGGSATQGDAAESQANAVHSIVIAVDGVYKDLYLNWHLVPESRPYIQPPEVKTQYVEIPGSDVTLDYTQALSGKPNYKNRTGSWDFLMIPDGNNPIVKYNEICKFLNGRRCTVQLRDYAERVYTGRVWVSSMKSDKMYSKITISYNLEPHPTGGSDAF